MPARPRPLIEPHDLAAALGLLTRLPVRVKTERALARGAASAWAWPLAGLAVWGPGAVAAAAALACGLGPGLAAGLMLALGVIVTGAMHEDGLADCCDAFWGGWDRVRRLAILKDSRVGSYAVLGLILALGLRWQALSQLMAQGSWAAPALAAAMLSRAAMAMVMATTARARPGGLSARAGRPSRATAGLAALVALGPALLLCGPAALAVLAVMAVTALATRDLAQRKIGGQTGDVLGAVQQLSEIAGLLCLAALR